MDNNTHPAVQDELSVLRQHIAELQLERSVCHRELIMLRAEREVFCRIVELTHDWAYWVTPDGGFRYVSPACERITGYRPEEFQADPGLLERIIHPDDRAQVVYHLYSEPQQHPCELEFRIITRGGLERWIGHTCQSIISDAGEWLGQCVSNRDITTHKQADEILCESQRFIQRFADTIPGVIYIYDVIARQNVYSNRQIADILGYTIAEVQAMGSRLMATLMHPDDWVTYLDYLALQAQSSDDTLLTIEYRMQHRDGTWRWMVSREVIFDRTDAGQVQQILGVAYDITERKQAEEALQRHRQFLRQIIDSNPAIIYARDRAGCFTLVNKALADVYGMPVEELSGKTDADMHLDIVEIAQISQEDQQVIATGTDMVIPERQIVDANGQTRYVSIVKRPLSTNDGPADQVLIVATDITACKRAALHLQHANKQLLQGNEQLRQRNQEVLLLNQMGDMLQGCLEFAEAYEVIAFSAAKLFPGQLGALYVRRDDTALFDAVATWGDRPPGMLAVEPHTYLTVDAQSVALFSSTNAGMCVHLSDDAAGATLCIPLIVQGETLGALHLCSNADGQHGARQRWVQLAGMVARQVSLALNNLALRAQLQQQAICDALTGLYNRRYLDATLPREVQHAVRHHQSVGVIMLDIDHFKRFNDTYGHDAGDTLLRTVGGFLQSHTRGEDIVCRYGGEEFTLVLPGTSLADIWQRAEEIRVGIQTIVVQHQGHWINAITASLGVAVVPDHSDTAEGVIKTADRALYEAKRSGRDRVFVAQESFLTTGEFDWCE